jgi:hypothetical protein
MSSDRHDRDKIIPFGCCQAPGAPGAPVCKKAVKIAKLRLVLPAKKDEDLFDASRLLQ